MFHNQKFVFTGFRHRDLAKYIESNGGTINTLVSKNTSMVIKKDDLETSVIMNKALELDIPILSFTEFVTKYQIESISNTESLSSDNFYKRGFNCERAKDYSQMIHYYTEASKLGNSAAMFRIGLYYLKTGNDLLALEWLEKDLTNPRVFFWIGECYKRQKNDVKMVEYYERAAEHGNQVAMNHLGAFYEQQEHDSGKAIFYYKMAAEKGNRPAQKRLKELLQSTNNYN
jgi:TPR repeat protein